MKFAMCEFFKKKLIRKITENCKFSAIKLAIFQQDSANILQMMTKNVAKSKVCNNLNLTKLLTELRLNLQL